MTVNRLDHTTELSSARIVVVDAVVAAVTEAMGRATIVMVVVVVGGYDGVSGCDGSQSRRSFRLLKLRRGGAIRGGWQTCIAHVHRMHGRVLGAFRVTSHKVDCGHGGRERNRAESRKREKGNDFISSVPRGHRKCGGRVVAFCVRDFSLRRLIFGKTNEKEASSA